MRDISTAAPKIGVTIARSRSVRRREIVMKGISTLLFLRPGATSVLLVMRRFVKEMVVLIPARTTATNKTSWAPKPEYFMLEEKGVIKVQPAVTAALFEHLVT